MNIEKERKWWAKIYFSFLSIHVARVHVQIFWKIINKLVTSRSSSSSSNSALMQLLLTIKRHNQQRNKCITFISLEFIPRIYDYPIEVKSSVDITCSICLFFIFIYIMTGLSSSFYFNKILLCIMLTWRVHHLFHCWMSLISFW